MLEMVFSFLLGWVGLVWYGYHGTTWRIATVWRARRLRLRSREPRAARGMWGRLVATVAARACESLLTSPS